MSDPKILELFKNGKREKAFTKLYPLYPRIEKLVVSNGGVKADAKDVFQEALIILYRNLQKTDFKLTSSFYTYLYSVSKFVWYDQQRKLSKEQLLNLDRQEVEILQTVVEEKKYKVAENAFLSLGERCQQLLRLFYLQKQSYQSIADQMGFGTQNGAKNQKYKCLQKARDIFQNSLKTVEL